MERTRNHVTIFWQKHAGFLSAGKDLCFLLLEKAQAECDALNVILHHLDKDIHPMTMDT